MGSAKRFNCLLLHPEELVLSYMTHSYEEAMKVADRTQSIEGRVILLTALMQTPWLTDEIIMCCFGYLNNKWSSHQLSTVS